MSEEKPDVCAKPTAPAIPWELGPVEVERKRCKKTADFSEVKYAVKHECCISPRMTSRTHGTFRANWSQISEFQQDALDVFKFLADPDLVTKQKSGKLEKVKYRLPYGGHINHVPEPDRYDAIHISAFDPEVIIIFADHGVLSPLHFDTKKMEALLEKMYRFHQEKKIAVWLIPHDSAMNWLRQQAITANLATYPFYRDHVALLEKYAGLMVVRTLPRHEFCDPPCGGVDNSCNCRYQLGWRVDFPECITAYMKNIQEAGYERYKRIFFTDTPRDDETTLEVGELDFLYANKDTIMDFDTL